MEFLHYSLKGPYAQEILEVTDTTITFNGYFRFENELVTKDRPIHRFFYKNKDLCWIAITGVKRGEDTSKSWYDEDVGGHICLTPTEIIEVEYNLLEINPNKERYRDLFVQMKEEDKQYSELNRELYEKRRKREMEEMCKECEQLHFKEFLAENKANEKSD